MAAAVKDVMFKDESRIKIYDSSEWAERGFCVECGSGLFYRLKSNGMTILNIGLFDDKEAFQLTGEIFFDHKPAGFGFSGDHERLSEAETLARFAEGSA